MSKFLSTPSARRATKTPKQEKSTKVISIHALREEGDRKQQKQQRLKNISIHALREEGDAQHPDTAISPKISIHALREEGDSACPALVGSAQEFLSTPSARRATKPRRRERSRQNISIHALREEGDAAGDGTGRRMGNFYPRPPRGGRPTHSQL